ncbi:MAG: glycosyltransferase [Acidimicrobiales bacterium]|nr:glycosyltransferase [Acidimicrobiales bacterium]MCB9372778.1 glycosyltransferase [Microthrixaceae bacterium]
MPAHGGYRLRVRHLARLLARAGDVTVAALGDAPESHDEPFDLVGVPHDFSRRRALRRSWRRPYLAALLDSPGLARLAAGGGWDLVVASSPFFVDLALGSGAPVVLDAHNVETDIMATLARTDERRLHRARWRWEAAKMAPVERAAVASSAAVLATSDADAAVFGRWGSARVEVVPNGVDTTAVAHAPPSARHALVYVGQYGYRPNESAARELVTQILPLVQAAVPDTTVELVGRNPTDAVRALAAADVAVPGPVDDVVPCLHQARALVVPLRAGSGTRLKILEAMAAGTPVVSTPLGAAGIDAVDGEHLLLGDTPEDLARQAVRALTEDELAVRLSAAARSLVERRYDWNAFAPTVTGVVADLVP